jgi:hypothetical protein
VTKEPSGLSAFQFADDKPRALAEARRESRRHVAAVVIPTRVSESAFTPVYQPLFPLFPADALAAMKRSGILVLVRAQRVRRLVRQRDAAGAERHIELGVRASVRMTLGGNSELATGHRRSPSSRTSYG